MMDPQTFIENMQFIGTVYNFRAIIPYLIFLFLLDIALKGWGMWRAARMGKKCWFIALLLVNSFGIFPLLFFSMTRRQYQELRDSEKTS